MLLMVLAVPKEAFPKEGAQKESEVPQEASEGESSHLIKCMLFDFELPKPLRPNVKAGCSLRKDQQEQEHTQANIGHFGFSVPQNTMSPVTPIPA